MHAFSHLDGSASHLLGPMLPWANSTFEASRVEMLSGMVRGQLEVIGSLKRPRSLVKHFLTTFSDDAAHRGTRSSYTWAT